MPRRQKNYHFIYKTTNNLNGKYYIGMRSTDNLDDGYLGSGKRLRYSIRKYGKENFEREILEFFDTREELREREREVVNLDEIAKKECMNLMVGGEGGYVSKQHYDYITKKGSKVLQEKLLNDKKFYDNWRLKSSKGLKRAYDIGVKDKKWGKDWTGCKHSEETRKKMSKNRKGGGLKDKNSQFGTCWITKAGENKKNI